MAQILIKKLFVAHHFLKYFVRLYMSISNFITMTLLQLVSLRMLLEKEMALRFFPGLSPSAITVMTSFSNLMNFLCLVIIYSKASVKRYFFCTIESQLPASLNLKTYLLKS